MGIRILPYTVAILASLAACSDIEDVGRHQPSNPEQGASGSQTEPVTGDQQFDRLRRLIHEALRTVPKDADGVPPIPADFAALSPTGFGSGNMSPFESDFTYLRADNFELLQRLAKYSDSSVRVEFEKRMVGELSNIPLRLLYAAQAAVCGSEKGALEILESLKSSDYRTVRNALGAIRMCLHDRSEEPPRWAVDVALAAIDDDRVVTGLEEAHVRSVEPLRVSYLADESDHLVWSLGELKYRAAVPLLIERLEKSEASRGYTMALQMIGDPRAVPPMLKCLQLFLKDKKSRDAASNTDRLGRLMTALGSFKAKEAVSLLVAHLEYCEAIQALEEIGDPQCVPALRGLIESRGTIRVDGEWIKWREKDRWAAARLALCVLEDKDPIPGLCSQLRDLSLGEFHRRDVLSRLYSRPDPRSVPVLIQAIRNDPSGSVVNSCIEVLSGLRIPDSVDGLIECFDASFEGKEDWKRAYTPQMFRDNIASSLRKLTGKNLPADKQQWVNWWKANRASFK